MNESSPKIGRYAVVGILILCLFIILSWFAFHEERSPLTQQPVKIEPTQPQVQRVDSLPEFADGVSSEASTNPAPASVTTNAATLYQQAFDLYNGLTQEQRNILRTLETNVDATAVAELCEKVRPICELMHHASATTNCDWGVDPINFDTRLPHLNAARDISRAAVWNATHCRPDDTTGATEDVLSVLRLGHSVSGNAFAGCHVDRALQSIASLYVTQHLELLHGEDNKRLAAAFDDPAYHEAPGRAAEQEAGMVERLAAQLASPTPDEAEKEIFSMINPPDENHPGLDRNAALTVLKQVVDLNRELARALTSSSQDGYDAWLQHVNDFRASSPLADELGGPLAGIFAGEMDQARGADVQRAMVAAGLAVAENGTEALAAHLDPSSGKPFVYTETDDGFELQSTFVVNDKPYKVRFK